MFTGLEGLTFFQFAIPFKLFYFPLAIKSLCFNSTENRKGYFHKKKAAENEQHSMKSFPLTFLIAQKLIFMTLYTINEFGLMKNSFCWQCSFLFSLLFYTFTAKFLFQFFWGQTPKPAEKNLKILKCCDFSSTWNLALSHFLNNVIQRHYIKCCDPVLTV